MSVVICMRFPGSGIAVAESIIRSLVRIPTSYSLRVEMEFPDNAHGDRVVRFLRAIA